MQLLKGFEGLKLSEQELDVWARANVRFFVFPSLRGRDLRAVAEEHTMPIDEEDSENRRIPASEFPRAYKVLEDFVSNYRKLLETGILDVNRLRRTRLSANSSSGFPGHLQETETTMNTATVLKEVIGVQIFPDQSADNPTA